MAGRQPTRLTVDRTLMRTRLPSGRTEQANVFGFSNRNRTAEIQKGDEWLERPCLARQWRLWTQHSPSEDA